MAQKVTKRQQAVLDCIEACIREKGYGPTVREVCQTLGLSSPSTVHVHLKALEDKGYIKRDPLKSRSIALTYPIEDAPSPVVLAATYSNLVNVPLVGDVAAGSPILAEENITDTITTEDGASYEVSIVDAAIPTVFIKAEALGLEGIETPAQIEGSAPLMARIEEIRGRCAEKIGLTDNWKLSTQKCPYAPFFAVVSPSKAYHTFDGKDVAAEDIDLVSRLLFMQKMHKTHPVTGTVCMSTAARVPGSIVEQVLSRRGRENRKIIIGHPAGVIPVVSELETENGTYNLKTAAILRTARTIMDGQVYVRKSRIK